MTHKGILVSLLLALSVLVGACSSDANKAGPMPSYSPTVLPTLPGIPALNDSAKVTAPPPPATKRVMHCPGVTFRYPTTIDQTKSFVLTLVDPYHGFGPGCPELAPGKLCQVPFQGSWRLNESAVGSVVFQIFENDSVKPLRSVEYGPIGSSGQFARNLRVLYPVSKTAHQATFRAVLKDITGREVATGLPQTVPIPSCTG